MAAVWENRARTPRQSREQEGLAAFHIHDACGDDRALKASPTGGLRPALTALPPIDPALKLSFDPSASRLHPHRNRTNSPNRVGLAADTALTKPAPSGMPE